MTENLLFQYVIFTVLNVIIQTAKSVMTIKCNKYVAAVANAVAYGFYTYIIVLTLCDLPMLEKCIITALANLVGVFVVKWVEEKAEKEKLWKVEATVPYHHAEEMITAAKQLDLSFNYVDISKYYLFNFYCPTQADSNEVKKLLNHFEAKYFVAEAKQEIL